MKKKCKSGNDHSRPDPYTLAHGNPLWASWIGTLPQIDTTDGAGDIYIYIPFDASHSTHLSLAPSRLERTANAGSEPVRYVEMDPGLSFRHFQTDLPIHTPGGRDHYIKGWLQRRTKRMRLLNAQHVSQRDYHQVRISRPTWKNRTSLHPTFPACHSTVVFHRMSVSTVTIPVAKSTPEQMADVLWDVNHINTCILTHKHGGWICLYFYCNAIIIRSSPKENYRYVELKRSNTNKNKNTCLGSFIC